MPDLSYPSSGGVLEAFLERIRFSRQARVDIDWLVQCLGISQRANAGRTLSWLRATKVIGYDGKLSRTGRDLLTFPRTRRYRLAALDSMQELLPPEKLVDLRSGRMTRGGLRRYFCQEYEVQPGTANKAIAGIQALAEAGGDTSVLQALGRVSLQRHTPRAPKKNLGDAKAEILEMFKLFSGRTGGIDGWLNDKTPDETFGRLMKIPLEPLTKAQLNQLLTLAHAAPVSDGFFRYYWLTEPAHPYDLTVLPNYSDEWLDSLAIFDLRQLYWGLYRFYIDALLYFGNIRAAYQILRIMELEELEAFFNRRLLNSDDLIGRGPSLPLNQIARDDRYLISEMACKSYEPAEDGNISLEQALREGFEEYQASSKEPTTPGDLLDKNNKYVGLKYPDLQGMFWFAAEEILDAPIASQADLDSVLGPLKGRFAAARQAALENTRLYLSSVGDMDVYVATSMRTRADFHDMAAFCDRTFGDRKLRRYHLRYFDPTLSAASNHQDKGLIECLMVKCAKSLVYTSGERDSYGKDAEAAMALSLGKPVIFFCESEERQEFYKEVHPLSRLVDFDTGVAVGAMVTDSEDEVVELLDRMFSNSMQYTLEERTAGYFVLREQLTQSVVRLQTNDALLRETFWNHYHGMRGNPEYVGQE